MNHTNNIIWIDVNACIFNRNYLLKNYLQSINEDPNVGEDIIFYAAFGGILGSKIYYLIERADLLFRLFKPEWNV